MIIGKYRFDNWKRDYYIGKDDCYSKQCTVQGEEGEYYFFIRIKESNEKGLYYIQFNSMELYNLHNIMYEPDVNYKYFYFSSSKAATEHVNLFLSKMQKLKAFI
jgi:hypothetical protein